MTCWALIDDADGRLIAAPLKEQLPAPGFVNVELPDGWPDTTRWNSDVRAFEPIPRRLNAFETVALYTDTERPRIIACRADEVRDVVLGIVLLDGIEVGSADHIGGTMVIDAHDLLDGPDRAARIIAGLPPETSV